MPSQGRDSTVRTWAQIATRSSAPSSTTFTATKIDVEVACCSG